MQKQFKFDFNKCLGCHACQIACSIENELDKDIYWRQITTFNEIHHPALPGFSISLACNHCEEPACLENCPASAYSKDENSGAVYIDQERCIGCKYCTWICPYDAPKYNKVSHVIEKCDFCSDRQIRNLKPACVELCPTGALGIEELKAVKRSRKPIDRDMIGFPDTGIGPAINFIEIEKGREIPEFQENILSSIVNSEIKENIKEPPSKINLFSELSLAFFTLLSAFLAALITASLLKPVEINLKYFIGAGVAGILMSSVHMGKKAGAYRALINWRKSWISREIVFFSIFLLTAGVYLIYPGEKIFGWMAAIFGFIALVSMDRVYQAIPQYNKIKAHSALVTFTGLFLAGIISGNPIIFGWFGIIKIYLYTLRKFDAFKTGKKLRPLIGIMRIGTGFLLPVILLFTTLESRGIIILLSIMTGEIIDRLEYYAELEVVTPEKQMYKDFYTEFERINKKVQYGKSGK